MTTYFPFGHIIAELITEIQPTIVRPNYFGDWTINADTADTQVAAESDQISEIYY